MSQAFEICHFDRRALRCGHGLQRSANLMHGARSVRFAGQVVLERNYHVFNVIFRTTTAQGAFHDQALKDEILQVTPLNPLALTPQGIAADVVVNGATQEVFLTPAVGD